MSSTWRNFPNLGAFELISGKKGGAHTENGAIEWMNINIFVVDSISKIVINNRNCPGNHWAPRIIESSLTVVVDGVTGLNLVISQANYDRNINTLIFESANFGNLTNIAEQYVVVHRFLVYDENGRNISAFWIPSISLGG